MSDQIEEVGELILRFLYSEIDIICIIFSQCSMEATVVNVEEPALELEDYYEIVI